MQSPFSSVNLSGDGGLNTQTFIGSRPRHVRVEILKGFCRLCRLRRSANTTILNTPITKLLLIAGRGTATGVFHYGGPVILNTNKSANKRAQTRLPVAAAAAVLVCVECTGCDVLYRRRDVRRFSSEYLMNVTRVCGAGARKIAID